MRLLATPTSLKLSRIQEWYHIACLLVVCPGHIEIGFSSLAIPSCQSTVGLWYLWCPCCNLSALLVAHSTDLGVHRLLVSSCQSATCRWWANRLLVESCWPEYPFFLVWPGRLSVRHSFEMLSHSSKLYLEFLLLCYLFFPHVFQPASISVVYWLVP